MGAQRRGKQCVYSFRRLSGAEQDGRLYYDRLRQYRGRRGVSCHIQFQSNQRAARRRRLLCAGVSIGRTYTYTYTNADGYTNTDSNAYCYTHSYSYTDAPANSNAKDYPDPKGASHSAAASNAT